MKDWCAGFVFESRCTVKREKPGIDVYDKSSWPGCPDEGTSAKEGVVCQRWPLSALRLSLFYVFLRFRSKDSRVCLMKSCLHIAREVRVEFPKPT